MSQFLSNIDLTRNQILNFRFQLLASPPSTPLEGMNYQNSTDHLYYIYNGSSWVSFVPNSSLGIANGVATLDSGVKVTPSQLPASSTTIPGIVQLIDSTNSTSLTLAPTANAVKTVSTVANAALPATGGTVSGNLVISGNLTVNGATETINSAVTTLTDPIITLGGATAPVSDDGKDRGVEFRWHNGTVAKVGFFGFDRSTGNLTFIPDATNTSEVMSGTEGTIEANAFKSIVATGTAPFTVASTTLVTNLNSDLLDGMNSATANTASTIVARDASGNFSAGTITATLTGNATTATTATNQSGGTVAATTGSFSGVITSTVANGTAPIVMTSTTKVVNLNADRLDDQDGTYYLNYTNLTNKPTILGKYAANIGDGVATAIVVTHNLGTMDCTWSVRLAASTYDAVYPDMQVIDANSIRLVFGVAPTSGQYRVVVIG